MSLLVQKLPNEIIEAIFKKVAENSLKDGRSLRLVCRFFNDLATRYGLPEITIHLHESDFNGLRVVASKDHLRHHVLSFIYVPDTIQNPGLLTDMYEDYRTRRTMDAREAPTRAARRKILSKPTLDRRQLHTHWARSKSIYSMQQSMLADEEDWWLLHDVLPQFPNIRELSMLSNQHGNTGLGHIDPRRLRKTPFDTGLMEFFWEPLEPEGYRALTTLLEALPERNKITSLRAGAVSWKFWLPGNSILSKAMDLAPNLTNICLQIETGYDPEEDMTGTQVAECRHTMQHDGKLREFLRRAPNLRKLFVDFEDFHEQNGYGAHLHDVIGPDQSWPHLQTFELGGVECEREQLTAFLKRHAATLEVLNLHSIGLQNTSWLKLLPEIRSILRLSMASISGEIFGEDEETSRTEYWDIVEPEQARTSLADALSQYLTCEEDHEHMNPLLDYLAVEDG